MDVRSAKPRSGRAVVGLAAILFLLASFARAQAVATRPDVWSSAEAAASAVVAKLHAAGASVAVVVDDEVRWSHGFGRADMENGVFFTANTVWRLGSISKPITAVAAMQLVERGRLDLDAPIQKYCPAFPVRPLPITSRQLLGHLAGIRHYKPDENFNSTRHYDSVVASLDAFKDDPLVHDPGAAFTYSTYGYVVLGCVIEGASGARYEDFVRENVWAPAGMDRTRTDDVAAIVPNRARGYALTPRGEFRNCDLADTSNKVPGGGLVSTAVDLGRFAIALDTGRLLKPETFRRMGVPMKTADGKESPYTGFSIGERRGEKMLTHSGGQQGTSTYLLMVPSKRFAVAVITNTEGIRAAEIAAAVADVVMP